MYYWIHYLKSIIYNPKLVRSLFPNFSFHCHRHLDIYALEILNDFSVQKTCIANNGLLCPSADDVKQQYVCENDTNFLFRICRYRLVVFYLMRMNGFHIQRINITLYVIYIYIIIRFWGGKNFGLLYIYIWLNLVFM